jgi:hypothetical protein
VVVKRRAKEIAKPDGEARLQWPLAKEWRRLVGRCDGYKWEIHSGLVAV